MLFLTALLMLFLFFISKEYEKIENEQLLHFKILLMILPFIITWISIDMIHPQDVMIESYTSKGYVFRYHVINMLIWSFLFSFLLLSFYETVKLLLYHRLPTYRDLCLGLHLFLDLFMVGFLSLLCAKTKHPTLGFIAPIIYVFTQLLIEYQESLTLYYVFPVFQPLMSHYMLAILYKVCYISLGFIIYTITKLNTKQIKAIS